ncbi:MAG: hypothetical protein IJT97_10020 [Bacteroidaceae bacterium]|nr:hypothetical protein [Bacteroidaceae bacterium]
MKPNNRKWLKLPLIAATAMAVVTSCKDDHFDVNPDVMSTKTIWQNIQNTPELSQYADILQNVYYSQTEEKTSSETYADFLNGEQTLTVWAPVNGKFKYDYYKGLLATGIRDSIYKVEKELIRNNMTRYSHILNGQDSVKLDLFNNKAAWLNFTNATLQGQKITQPNIASSNGVLHIIDGAANYQPNLYEFLATRGELDSINTFIKSFQKTEFNENASTQGPTVNGQITWVDSITYISNSYTSSFTKAYLNREDSNYVMIMPTNTVWSTLLEKTKNYYKFKQEYNQTVHTQTEQGNDTIYESKTSFTQEELDSMVNLYSKNSICQHLIFNANWQYERIPITSIEDIRAIDTRKDSLKSTANLKFKATGTLNETNKNNVVEVDNFAEMFGNADPIETSNGYAYIVNEWKLPSTVYAPVIDIASTNAFEYSDVQCIDAESSYTYRNPYVIRYEIGENDEKIPVDTLWSDSIYKYNYLSMNASSPTSHPGAYFKLQQKSSKYVLSGKYDIFVVIGYNTEENKPNRFRAYLYYDTENGRITKDSEATLKNPNEDAVDVAGASLLGGNIFVNRPPRFNIKDDKLEYVAYNDTICLARDKEFPISYYGLDNAYPTLYLKSNFKSNDKDKYSRNIWVNAVILKPKE